MGCWAIIGLHSSYFEKVMVASLLLIGFKPRKKGKEKEKKREKKKKRKEK